MPRARSPPQPISALPWRAQQRAPERRSTQAHQRHHDDAWWPPGRREAGAPGSQSMYSLVRPGTSTPDLSTHRISIAEQHAGGCCLRLAAAHPSWPPTLGQHRAPRSALMHCRLKPKQPLSRYKLRAVRRAWFLAFGLGVWVGRGGYLARDTARRTASPRYSAYRLVVQVVSEYRTSQTEQRPSPVPDAAERMRRNGACAAGEGDVIPVSALQALRAPLAAGGRDRDHVTLPAHSA